MINDYSVRMLPPISDIPCDDTIPVRPSDLSKIREIRNPNSLESSLQTSLHMPSKQIFD